MKALILNSGIGSRMGEETKLHPKCMTSLGEETIISRQLKQLLGLGIKDIVITTGYYSDVLIKYCRELDMDIEITFVNNIKYDRTNYIYSIYCAKEFLQDDIVLMHGDLVFDTRILKNILIEPNSCMVIDKMQPLPEKDFKAVLEGERIKSVGIEFFENVAAAQPLYKLNYRDWKIWLDEICSFCESGEVKCYAENAFNRVSDMCELKACDVSGSLCGEIDTVDDWKLMIEQLAK